MSFSMTLRLDDEQGAALRLVAAVDDQKMSTLIRDLIEQHIKQRRGDAEFKERLRIHHEEQRELYERLARGA